MDEEITQKLLHELFPHLEAMETRIDAILQFLKDKGIATDEQLAPYLEEAGKASYVKWLATGLRAGHILSLLMKEVEKPKEEEPRQVEKSANVPGPHPEPSAGEEDASASDQVNTETPAEPTEGVDAVAGDRTKKSEAAEADEEVDADAA